MRQGGFGRLSCPDTLEVQDGGSRTVLCAVSAQARPSAMMAAGAEQACTPSAGSPVSGLAGNDSAFYGRESSFSSTLFLVPCGTLLPRNRLDSVTSRDHLIWRLLTRQICFRPSGATPAPCPPTTAIFTEQISRRYRTGSHVCPDGVPMISSPRSEKLFVDGASTWAKTP